MARKTDETKLTAGLRYVRGGASVEEAAKAAGVSRSVLYAEIGRLGATAPSGRPRAAEAPSLPDDGDVDVAELTTLVDELRRRMGALPDGSPRYGPLAAVYASTLEKRRRMRPLPGPTPEELADEKRRADGETRARIERYVLAYEADAAARGVCLHCDQPLPKGAT